jgi:Tol biopolymer transport system component
MNAFDDDRILTAWLEAAAPAREPEHLLNAVLTRTARTRRRPAWLFLSRWIPMDTATARVAPNPRVPLRMIALVALAVLALVATALIAGGQRNTKVPAPFGPAANGHVVYSAGGQLFVQDTLTSVSRPLDAGANAVGPEFSRDGTRLAWFRGVGPADAALDTVELWVADADGRNPRQLGGTGFADPRSYAWSPDGDAIALIEAAGAGRYRLVMIPTDGASAAPVLPGYTIDSVAWRPPDGTQLVVRGRETGAGGPMVLHLVNRDGSGLTRLDLDPTFDSDANYSSNVDYYFMDPAWSPDGTRLAFHGLEDVFAEGDPDPGWRVHVATIGPDGTVADEQTFNAEPAIDDEFTPQWLPDGSGLVVNRLEEGVPSLAIQRLDGASKPIDLGSPARATFPATVVSPDGAEVLAWIGPHDGLGARAWSVNPATGTASDIAMPVDDWASWQRLAPGS